MLMKQFYLAMQEGTRFDAGMNSEMVMGPLSRSSAEHEVEYHNRIFGRSNPPRCYAIVEQELFVKVVK